MSWGSAGLANRVFATPQNQKSASFVMRCVRKDLTEHRRCISVCEEGLQKQATNGGGKRHDVKEDGRTQGRDARMKKGTIK